MKKLLFQLSIMLFILALIWIGFSHLDFVKLFRPQQRLDQGEKKLGELILNVQLAQQEKIEDPGTYEYFAQILKDVHEKNNINDESIDIILLKSKTVNAFALPGRNMIIMSGMVDFVETPEELIAVLSHEIAHIEANHVMRKLRREIGMATLLSVVSGNYNLDLLREIASLLATNSYSRVLENEADRMALDYMYNAGIDPMGLVQLFMRFAENFGSFPQEIQWISTHPSSVERAERLEFLLAGKPQKRYKEFDLQEWKDFKTRLQAW